MKLRILFVIIIISLCLNAFAQKATRGKVYDGTTNSPLAGATITFTGRGGTTTDVSGSFSFDCSKTTRITASYIGYESYQKVVKNCDEEINISLVPSNNKLNEVEVTATSNRKAPLYQPQSVTKLGEVELNRGTGLFLDDAINANVPGVTMQRRAVSSGQQFNIRGYGNGVRFVDEVIATTACGGAGSNDDAMKNHCWYHRSLTILPS